MDRWNKMKQCDCGCIDTSPNVREPYCMIYFEDYNCDNCTATQVQKDQALKIFDDYDLPKFTPPEPIDGVSQKNIDSAMREIDNFYRKKRI